MDSDRLALHPDLPLQGCPDVVGAVIELEPEDVGDRPPDRLLGGQAGELERALATVDDPAVGVAGEERRIWRRVVVVEQLEQVGEPALLASPGLAGPERDRSLGCHRPVAAVGADEVMLARHRSGQDSQRIFRAT